MQFQINPVVYILVQICLLYSNLKCVNYKINYNLIVMYHTVLSQYQTPWSCTGIPPLSFF